MTVWGIFLSAYLVGFSGALAPGPLLTVTVNESFHRGFRAGPQLVTGHALLEVFIVALIAGGFYRHVKDNPYIYGTVAIAGGLFLAWMGWKLIAGAANKTIRLDLDAKPEGKKAGPLILGAIVSLSNPFFIIWWLSIGSLYVAMAVLHGLKGLVVFTLGHVLADYTWYSLVSAVVGGGRKFFNQSVYRTVIFSCGLFLTAMAAYFIFAGVLFIFG
ncbi:MAG: LysE family transporter [Dethiobacter sp.]|jgi:threonine/homoserine/homoserine lactone efflux protein|nr:LysE family transporter [Dethiobacter sp.]